MSTSLRRRISEQDRLFNADQSTHEKKKNINKIWRQALFPTIFRHRAQKSTDFIEDTGFEIDQLKLKKLVAEEDLEGLEGLGRVAGVAIALRSNAHNGIADDDDEIRCRRETFGEHKFKSPPKRRFFHFLRQAAVNPAIFILIICGALSLGFGIKVEGLKYGWTDGGGIFIGVVVFILVVATSKYLHNKILEKSQEDSMDIKISVVRGRRLQQIRISEIVVGDVVCLKSGDQVPAHGLLFEGLSCPHLKLNRAGSQGVSDEGIESNNRPRDNPFLFPGTVVVDGFARLLVTSVGMDAEGAQTMSATDHVSSEKAPLQLEHQLEELEWITDKVGYVLTFVVFVIILAGMRYSFLDEEGNPLQGIAKINAIIGVLVTIITTVIDVTDPWKLSLTLTRAYAMHKLRKTDKSMVLKPSSLETLGCATIICTDKTGVLTENKMQVVEFYTGVMEKGTDLLSIHQNVIELLREGIGLNTTRRAYNTGTTSRSEPEISDNITEKAIFSWAAKYLEINMVEVERRHHIRLVESFHSERKRSGILMQSKLDNTMQTHWKGAAQLILTMCTCYYDDSGNTKYLDADHREQIQKEIEAMAAKSLRCIAFAHKIVSQVEFQDANRREVPKDGLTLLGIVGIRDHRREGVIKAVQDFKAAVVKIQMITGDDFLHARAKATDYGILINEDDAIEGIEFENYSEEKKLEMADKISVMARASPEHKRLLVRCLREKGHVVAVTGDDIKDITAMEAANVGLFMGSKQCTEAAKESCDIIIEDSNLASIFNALRWGRCVYSNVRKFVQTRLTLSITALLVSCIGQLSAEELPLTAVQLLWVSLVMDTLGSLAFAAEEPTKEDMEKPLVRRETEPVVTNIMLKNIFPQVLYQVALLMILLHLDGVPVFGIDIEVNETFIFNCYVLCQVFNELNSRKLKEKNVLAPIHGSIPFFAIVAFTILLHVILVELLENFADTVKLNWSQWGLCVGFAFLTLPIGLVARCIQKNASFKTRNVCKSLMAVGRGGAHGSNGSHSEIQP